MNYLYISDKKMSKDLDNVNLNIRCIRPSLLEDLSFQVKIFQWKFYLLEHCLLQ